MLPTFIIFKRDQSACIIPKSIDSLSIYNLKGNGMFAYRFGLVIQEEDLNPFGY